MTDRYLRRSRLPLALEMVLALACIVLTCGRALAAESSPPLDPVRVRELMRRAQSGETLSREDQDYLDYARERIRQRAQKAKSADKGVPGAGVRFANSFTNLVPLTDLTNRYKGEDGGLYGGGRNQPPAAHWTAYLKESAGLRPLDAAGEASPDGKIGLVIVGFSNTMLEAEDFKRTADADPEKSARVVIVNGAMGGRAAVMWAYDGAALLPEAEQKRVGREMDLLHMPKEDRRGSKDTWPTLDSRVHAAGLTSNQVQVLWMKHVDAQPGLLGEFPAHARALQADMADVVLLAKKHLPNVRVAYFSSRTFGGWSSPNSGSPEPFAYESAFAARWLVQAQIAGDATLNFDPARGQVTAPLLLWGPYLWTCGDRPRADGLVWSLDDVRANDHLHPSAAGCRKITKLLLDFLKHDEGARRWFVASR
jgi:hypothetical protein